MSRLSAIALLLATVLGIVLAVVLLPNDNEWDNGVAGVSVSPESSSPIAPGNSATTNITTTVTTGRHTSPDSQAFNSHADSAEFSIWNVATWSELQEVADRTNASAHAHSHVPEDTGSGYFDGVISGGFEATTRFRLNDVSAFIQHVEEQETCQIHLEAWPKQGDDAVAYGTVSINLTAEGVPCDAPRDLVGRQLLGQDLERYSVQVSSSFGLDAAGSSNWGTVWLFSDEVGEHFDLRILGYEDDFLLGTFEGYMELSLYQHEDVRNQHRRGHFHAVFRAKI